MAFLQEPQRPHQPMIRAPFVVLATIGVLTLAYLGQAFAPPRIGDQILMHFAFIPARYSATFLAAHSSPLELVIPFVSYIFLHGGFDHLAINCLWLLAFGPIVARRWGAGLFLTIFVICAVAAAFAHLATNWGSQNPVIGASGAISGLMGAGIRMLRGRVWLDGEPFPRPASLFSSPVVAFTAFWILANVLAGYMGIGVDGQLRLIAWQAHIGGYFAGLLLVDPFDAIARRRHLNP